MPGNQHAETLVAMSATMFGAAEIASIELDLGFVLVEMKNASKKIKQVLG